MKIKVIDPNGVHFAGKVLPVDSAHEIAKGPHTAAWLRFKQVEELEAKPAKSEAADAGNGEKAPKGDKGPKGDKPDKK